MAESGAEPTGIAEAYEQAARIASSAERDASLTIELRRANNFVKDGPIRACISFWASVLRAGGGAAAKGEVDPSACPPRLEVLDLCCGRGQDFDKFRRAARDSRAVLSKLVGADLSGGDTAASARERWVQSAEWVMRDNPVSSPTRPTVMMGGVLTADLGVMHSARAIDLAMEYAHWDPDSAPQPASMHLATCFFALHYFFRSPESLSNLLAGVSWYLRDGGFFATIHADGEAIAKRARAELKGRGSPQGPLDLHFGQARVRLSEATARMLLDDDPVSDAVNPFGWDYTFELPGAVLNVDEYMVHSPTRDRYAENVHLIKLLDESAAVLLNRMTTVPFWAEAFVKCQVDCSGASGSHSTAVSPSTLEALSMYRVVIYGKFPLGCDVIPARRFIRSKLGLSV
jgi:SAM-dependent methyltransferase